MKMRLASILIAALWFLASGASAHIVADDHTVEMVSGTILSTSRTSLVIRTDSGLQRTFATTERTLLPLEELTTGDRVSVRYRVLDADRAEAMDVTLVEPSTTQSRQAPLSRLREA